MAKSRRPKVRLYPRTPAGAAVVAAPMRTELAKLTAKQHRAGTSLRPSDPEFWTVINEIADPVPIVPAELDAIESYFSAMLDDVFNPTRKSSL